MQPLNQIKRGMYYAHSGRFFLPRNACARRSFLFSLIENKKEDKRRRSCDKSFYRSWVSIRDENGSLWFFFFFTFFFFSSFLLNWKQSWISTNRAWRTKETRWGGRLRGNEEVITMSRCSFSEINFVTRYNPDPLNATNVTMYNFISVNSFKISFLFFFLLLFPVRKVFEHSKNWN